MNFKQWFVFSESTIWPHSGTQFTEIGGAKSFFTGKGGDRFVIEIESTKSLGGWGYTVLVHTEDGKLVGSAHFTPNGEIFAGPKGTYSTDMVSVKEPYRRQGIARAIYDCFTEQVGPIYRHEYQTPDGRQLWGSAKSSSPKVFPSA
jgi:GNAT superfamily N-acetyltransferase